jgi:hypothetical protein
MSSQTHKSLPSATLPPRDFNIFRLGFYVDPKQGNSSVMTSFMAATWYLVRCLGDRDVDVLLAIVNFLVSESDSNDEPVRPVRGKPEQSRLWTREGPWTAWSSGVAHESGGDMTRT